MSRPSAHVKLHSLALEQHSLMDLFVTLPHTRMGPKNERGKPCSGRCDLLRASFGPFLAWCTNPQLLFNPFTTAKSTTFVGPLPNTCHNHITSVGRQILTLHIQL